MSDQVFELTDEEIDLVTRMCIQYSNWLREDFAKVAGSDASELIRAAATDIYNKEVQPVSELHVRLQQERISRGLVKEEELPPGVGG